MPLESEFIGIGPTGALCLPMRTPSGFVPGSPDIFAVQDGGCIAGVRLPESGHMLAPWVAITFEGSGSVITVGNESSRHTDRPNVACIRSFEFGHSDGMTVRVVIQDQEGGSFVTFMEHMVKDYVCLKYGSPASVRMKFQFGWSKSGCEYALPGATSRCYYALCDSVETNYAGGKIIFELTGKDLCHRMFEGGCSQDYGGEGEQAVPLTEAIRELMTEGCSPNVGSVGFYRMEGGVRWPCGWKDGTGPGKRIGPAGKWICNGFNKLDVVLGWIKGHPTDRNVGWIPQYNCEEPNGELIFWEDPKPLYPEGHEVWNANCIGQYIVNGGKASPVLEFNPKIRWNFASLTSNGGQLGNLAVNGTGEDGSRLPGAVLYGLDAKRRPCQGLRTQAPASETHRDLGTDIKGMVDGINAQSRALRILTDNIEADLVVVGDPTLLAPSEAMQSKNVTIVVVNPHYLSGPENKPQECEWLARPVYNEVLTNKGWICKSITHKIEAGKYTTTIGVYLTGPGVDGSPDNPLGLWTGGWHPVPQC